MIFAKGDFVKYHGGVLVEGANVLMAGDEVHVIVPNEDYDTDARVVLPSGASFLVQPEDLEWIASGS